MAIDRRPADAAAPRPGDTAPADDEAAAWAGFAAELEWLTIDVGSPAEQRAVRDALDRLVAAARQAAHDVRAQP